MPPYLRAVSICKPKGNIAADVSYEISRMCDALRGDGGDGGLATGDIGPLARGVVAAVGFGVLAAIVAVLTNQLANADILSGMPQFAKFVFHGISLSIMVWLAALFFGVREPIAFGVLAAGCITAFLFENEAWRAMGTIRRRWVPANR